MCIDLHTRWVGDRRAIVVTCTTSAPAARIWRSSIGE